ncbi:phenylalanine--tRNA ligase beta subunit-related protein, partial [Enterococcus faecalis]|uniref:phenylalanine--tRNA ligase beta subunit-related protein n=1 Tax=Enterococcus faecalis TaxID=1351 RepID=UPI003D6BAD9D
EVGAIYRHTPHFNHPELKQDASDNVGNYLTVTVEDSQDAPAYQIGVIKDVTIAESPQWLQHRLINEEIRPINNDVDVK